MKASGSEKGGREPWDLRRFGRTVAFFNEDMSSPAKALTTILTAPLKALGNMVAGSGAPAGSSSAAVITLVPAAAGAAAAAQDSHKVIMVTGATGGVGKRVVERLLEQGRVVRALVRDVDKAKTLLASLPVAPSGALQLVAADISQRRTLTPDMFAGVGSVISCTAVKVQPKEGDTPDREKYYQGIKFYDPEIVGDTPEAVEYRGLANVLDAAAEHLGYTQGKAILVPDSSSAARWGALDDVVMGGVSESSIVFSQSAGENGRPAMVFRGNVSTSNSGGFVSVRCKNFDPALDLAAYGGLRLRLLGNGLRYKCIIRTDSSWDGIGYCRSFDTKDGEWQDITLPFAEFIPTFRAKTLRDGSKLNPVSVCSVQLMLSKFEYDGELNPAFKSGPMQLPIEAITAYLEEPITPRFVHVSSAGVTRPNRPGINVDQEPPAVKLNDALGGLLTYKLAGEDAVRESGVPAVIVRPCALTEEPAGAPLELDQGDVIKGKIPREDVADLCVSLLQLPSAVGTTFEVKSTIPFSQPWEGGPGGVAEPRDWAAELAGAGIRPGVTGKTVDGVYTGKEPEVSAAAGAGAAAVAAKR
jgi:uncharacterized protein YbjT (DUF2867 family)